MTHTITTKNDQVFLEHFIHRAVKQEFSKFRRGLFTLEVQSNSPKRPSYVALPWVFDGETLHFKELSQRVILTVDYVLPLFVIQLPSHDVLPQVVHHLKKNTKYYTHILHNDAEQVLILKHAHLFECEDFFLGSGNTQNLQERGFGLYL